LGFVSLNLGEYYQLVCQCGCESGLVSSWYKNEKGAPVKACDRCKPKLLFKIFDERYLNLFEDWAGKILFADPAPLGYEWQWEDLLKEKGCEQVVGLEAAKQKQNDDQILIPCPNGDVISMDPGDRSVHILVPKTYAELVLENGKMV
jgi:hypothetical protein